MRRNNLAILALKRATASGDTFVDTDLLHARGVGRAALNGFMGAGWIVAVEPIAADHQSFRLTSFGREALAAVLRHIKA